MVVAPKEDATAPSRPQQHCTGCSGRWVVTFQRSCSPGLIRSATSQCSEMPSNCPGEGAPPHPPQVVPLLLEEADGHSRRFSLHHGSHEGEHTTRIIFSSPVVPWGRQNCPATQLRRRWRGGRGGGHTLGTQLTSGFLPGFSEASTSDTGLEQLLGSHLISLCWCPLFSLLWTTSILHKT